MSQAKVMGWVSRLPGVSNVLLKKCESVNQKMAEAQELGESDQRAKELRSAAYFEALEIESIAGAVWTAEAIAEAKAGEQQSVQTL